MASKRTLNTIVLGNVVHLKGSASLVNLNKNKSNKIAEVLSKYNTIVVDGDPFGNQGFTQILNNNSLRNKQLLWFKFSDPGSNIERLKKLNKYPNHLRKFYVTLNNPTNLKEGQAKWMVLGHRAFNAISRQQNGRGKHDVVIIGGGSTLKSELKQYILKHHTNPSKNTELIPFVVNSLDRNGVPRPPSWVGCLSPPC